MALSDTACRNARGREKPYKISDAEGLHLLVQTNGSRLWRLAYRFDGKQKTLALGKYPAVTLGDARALKDAARRQLAFGIDPAAAAQIEVVEQVTFEKVARNWLATWKTNKSDLHVERVTKRLEDDVFPAMISPRAADGSLLAPVRFGDRPIREIEPPEILDVVRKVQQRGALDVSRRIRGHISLVFSYAIPNGQATRNPASDITKALKPKPRAKHYAKLPVAQIGKLAADITRYDGDPVTRMALKWTLLTWVRTTDTRGARHSEIEDIDGPEPLWRIPGERMKMGREHLVPLSPQAVEIYRELLAVPRVAKGEYLFPSDIGGDGIMSQNTMLFALYRMGYRSRLTVHGFRGMGSTWANEAMAGEVRRYDGDWVEMQLAHDEEDEVRGAYNSALYLAPRRRMLCDWGDMIEHEEMVALLVG